MKDNSVILLVGEVVLGILGGVALFTGDRELAYVCAGAFVGLLGGHLNGTHAEIPPKVN